MALYTDLSKPFSIQTWKASFKARLTLNLCYFQNLSVTLKYYILVFNQTVQPKGKPTSNLSSQSSKNFVMKDCMQCYSDESPSFLNPLPSIYFHSFKPQQLPKSLVTFVNEIFLEDITTCARLNRF